MKILLHTMATPHLDLPGAIRQARALGLDGVEVVRQEGYRCALSPRSSLTAARTMRIWRAVGHAALGVIYEPGNLAREGKEAFPASLIAQSDAIRHVHVKDYVFAPDLPNGRRAVPPGEGMLGWGAIIAALSQLGYEGDLTLEYEMRWVPDQLPPPAIGLAVG